MRFRVVLRQLYLQEFTAATSFVTVVRTQKAYAVHRAAIGRRGALDVREVQLDVPGQFREVGFQVAAGRCVYAAETFSATKIDELFRCPADIEVVELESVEKPLLHGSFHFVVANLFPQLRGAFYTVEFEASGFALCYELGAEAVKAGDAGEEPQLAVQLLLNDAEYAPECTASVVLCCDGAGVTLLRVRLEDYLAEPYAFRRGLSFADTAARWPIQHALYAPVPAPAEQHAGGVVEVKLAQFCVISSDAIAFSHSDGLQSTGCTIPSVARAWLRGRQVPFLARSGGRFYSNLAPCTWVCDERATVFVGEDCFELSLGLGPEILINDYRFELNTATNAFKSAPQQPITDETISFYSLSQPTSPSSVRPKALPSVAPIFAENAICGDCRQQQRHLRRLRVETQLVEQMRRIEQLGVTDKKAKAEEKLTFNDRTTTRGTKVEQVLLGLEKCFRANETAFYIQYNNAVIASLLRRIRRRGLEVSDAVLYRLGELQLLYSCE